MGEISFSDLQSLIVIKTCFFIFVGLGILALYKKIRPAVFLIIFGALSALSYIVLVHGTRLMFWGMQGDENFISALFYAGAHGMDFLNTGTGFLRAGLLYGFFHDFAYTGLPAFYPPLFFWIAGLPGRFFNWNGVQIAKFANAAVFLFFPVIFFAIQKWYWGCNKKEATVFDAETVGADLGGAATYECKNRAKTVGGAVAWLVSAVALFVLVDTDAIILKQYEFVTAALTVLWTAFFIHRLHSGYMSVKQMFFFGILAGFLFMSFYFWLFFSAIGIAIYNLFSNKRITLRQYAWSAGVAVVMLAIAMPFWLPLAYTYINIGSENFQVGYTNIFRMIPIIPFAQFSFRGFAALLGFGVLLIYMRCSEYIRSLFILFLVPYVWQIVGFVTIFFFSSPLQESKGFMFWNAAVLALAIGYGAEQLARRIYLWSKAGHCGSACAVRSGFVRAMHIIIVILAAQGLIFGTFTNDVTVLAVKTRAQSFRPGVAEVSEFLKTYGVGTAKNSEGRPLRILHSGIPELHALLSFDDVIYYNQHDSHPAALFSEQLQFLRTLEQIQSPKEFYTAVVREAADRSASENSAFHIDMFVFYKGEDAFPVYLHVDDFPNGFKEIKLNFEKYMFMSDFFEKIYENGHYVVFAPHRDI